MKILIVSCSAPPLSMGGVSSAHYNLFQFLLKKGFNVRLVTYSDKKKIDDQDSPQLTRIKGKSILLKLISLCFKFINKIIFRDGIAYQTHSIIASNINCIALSRYIFRSKPDILIVPDHGLPSLATFLPKHTHVIQIEHHNPARFLSPLIHQRKMSVKDVRLATRLHQINLRKVSTVVCPSRYMKDVFYDVFTFENEVHVIPNILDLKYIQSIKPELVANKLFLSREHPIIYIPSGGSSVKGERYILPLIQRIRTLYPEAYFFISGDITVLLQEELKISCLQQYVYAPGFLPYHTALALAASCSLCVSPCLAENFGMAIFESLALGLPVFAFDVGGNRDIVSDDCGRLIPCLDIESLASIVAAYMRGDLPQISSDNAKNRAVTLNTHATSSFCELLHNIASKGN